MIDYEEATKTMQKCLDKFFANYGYNIEVSNKFDKIWITDYQDKYASGRSMLMCGVFEQIYVLTGFYICAIDASTTQDGVKYIQVTMHHKDAYETVNKDGIYWEDLNAKAKCPNCGETASFDLMKYSPTDLRDMQCPVCKKTNIVKNYWKEIAI